MYDLVHMSLLNLGYWHRAETVEYPPPVPGDVKKCVVA
jgi:hypothetical protein